MQKTLVILLILALTSISLFAKSNEVYFKFQIEDKGELEQITKIISIDNVQNNVVFAYANSKEMDNFTKLGLSYTVLPHPNSLIDVAMTNGISKIWTAYPTYDAYIAAMYQFAIDYPDICSVQNIGNSIEGREILFVKISDNVSLEEAEPEFMYSGQMHGDELVSYIVLLDLIEYLLSNYGTDSYIQNLVNNIEIWINPLSNPDGTYAGGNSTVSGATRYNSNSVDLNRNFPDAEDGDHPDGNAWQTENIHMMNFADSHNFIHAANIHSGAEVVNYPWDTWSTLHADDDWYQYISHLYADEVQADSPGVNYMEGFNDGITNGYAWYTTNGNRQDYFNYFQNCREVTLELSTVKMLQESELENHWNYNKDALLQYIEHTLFGIRGITTDENGDPIEATIQVVDHDNNNSQVISDLDFGDYYRMVYPGTHDLIFSAAGYDDVTVNNVGVTQNNATEVNIQFGGGEVTQAFNFGTGWDLVSLNVHPTDMSPASIFAPIASELEQVKNLTQSYDPDAPEYLNTLDFMVDGEGYWVNMNTVAYLDITGFAVDINSTPINLYDGWNLAGYPCQISQDASTATSAIIPYLLQMKNLSQSFDPTLPDYMNTLSDMYPNMGYWFEVSQNCAFTYPTPARDSELLFPDRDLPETWVPIIYPNNSATLYAVINTAAQLSSDDVLAAFCGEECRGIANIIEHNSQYFATLLIQISEQDELINFKFYDDSSDVIYDCTETISVSFGEIIGEFPDNLFDINSILTHQDEEVTQISFIELKQNYPNPFNPTTTIEFSLDKLHNAELTIYNLKGQKIRQYPINQKQSSIIWDGDDEIGKKMPSGVYLYRLSVDDKVVSSRKMILMK